MVEPEVSNLGWNEIDPVKLLGGKSIRDVNEKGIR